MMTVNLHSAEQVYVWNRRMFSIGGMWPLESAFIKFYIGYVYVVLQLAFAIDDFVSVFGDLTLMIANLLVTSVHVMLSVKMIILRHSEGLKRVLHSVSEGFKENNYRNETEKELYLAHIIIGRNFFKIGGTLAFITTFAYYLTPFRNLITAAIFGETLQFVLPYRMTLLTNITDIRLYALLYLSQAPMIYYYHVQSMSVFFLCTVIVHITGEMSVLTHRIRLIGPTPDSRNDYESSKRALQRIVEKHRDIIRTASTIDDIFNIPLLEELIISTMLIGLAAYNLLANTLSVSIYEIFVFANYSISLLILILVYCITGDYLIRESANICDAYYECRWYDMRPKDQKYLIICMLRAQKPLQLTAGGFYIFSLPRYSEILKTTMAYISMLRAVV